jgi:luciferase family oxidoreductase group 1
MADPLVLSVLDQSPVSEGSSSAEALHHTLDLARLADELGYHRYWLAEHHGGTMLAGPSPEVLIGPVAMATSRIRVGSGGVMLPHYSPLKVAESFSILAGLFPERIDLAIGRAPGTDPLTTFALQRDRRQAAPDDFPTQLAELLGLLENRLPHDHPFRRLADLPGLPHAPEPWLLGSSPQSGIWAAELGLPYAFADFINPTGAQIAARYRTEFIETGRATAPRVAVGVWAICAETDEEAQRLAASARMAMMMLRRGRPIAIPPVDKAVRFLESEGEALDAMPPGRRTVVGSPATVAAGLREAAESYGADEVVVVSITHEHEARRRSYALIAEAFDLAGAAAAERVAS